MDSIPCQDTQQKGRERPGMRWIGSMAEKIKGGLQSWLSITPAQPSTFNIQETISFDANIIKNRIWYIGDPDEL